MPVPGNSGPGPPPAGDGGGDGDGDSAADLKWCWHESALNNREDGLARLRLDEATFLAVLSEDLKLAVTELSDLPAGRTPAVLVLAESAPLEIRFDQGQVSLTLRLDQIEFQGQAYPVEGQAVHAVYRLGQEGTQWELAHNGALQLVPAEGPHHAQLEKVLGRFLPRSFRPAPRFRNDSLGTRLELTDLRAHNGWLLVAARQQIPGETQP